MAEGLTGGRSGDEEQYQRSRYIDDADGGFFVSCFRANSIGDGDGVVERKECNLQLRDAIVMD